MAIEETKSAGLARLHLIEAMHHLELASEHMINLCNNEECEDIRYEILSAQRDIDMIHIDLMEQTDNLSSYSDWSGLEALIERMSKTKIKDWSAYQFSEWKQSGKVKNNG